MDLKSDSLDRKKDALEDLNVDDVRFAFQVRNLAKKGKSGALLMMILGVAAFFPFTAATKDLINGILAVTGLTLIGAGIWNYTNASPLSYMVSGITYMASGLWSLVVTFHSHSPVAAVFWLPVAGFQLFNGYKSFTEARENEAILNGKVSDRMARNVETISQELAKANPQKHDDIIEFRTHSLIKTLYWKGRLCDNLIYLQAMPDDFLYCLDSKRFDVEFKEKVSIEHAEVIEFTLNDVLYKGSMPDKSAEKFKPWKRSIQDKTSSDNRKVAPWNVLPPA